MAFRQNKMANRGPDVEETERNSVAIPSSELFNFVVECDKYHVDTIYDVGKDKVNKLPVLRLPVVVGNAIAITKDADEKRDDLFNLLKRHPPDEKPKLEPFRCVSVKNSYHMKPDRNVRNISKTKASVSSSESTPEVSSELSDNQTNNENLGIVKSILGPSFEDAVLRTLEFGKSLIQKAEVTDMEEKDKRSDKKREERRKEKLGEGDKRKEGNKWRNSRKGVAERERKGADVAQIRATTVAKIRSLDSELKQVAQTPEKIKRQLEALIQINKDQPPELFNTWGYFYPKEYSPLKPHLEYTVMPTTVIRQPCCALSKKEGCSCGPNCTSTPPCCAGNRPGKSRGGEDSDDGNSSRKKGCATDDRSTRSMPNPVRQAPEYITNALGPSLDVSIMDNLKLMRNLFRCEKGDQEGDGASNGAGGGEPGDVCVDGKTTQQKAEELQCLVSELMAKKRQLEREIEEEERERDAKRKAFLEEMERMRAAEEEARLRACQLQEDPCARVVTRCPSQEQKFEALRCRIQDEEDRLNALKEMGDTYETVINEAKKKQDFLKRNKSLLDAWDVIASKPCHTKLPSFSRIQCLERKNCKSNKDAQHCCFPQTSDGYCKTERYQDIQQAKQPCGRSRSLDSKTPRSCRFEGDDMPYPIQRDITCGLHRTIKTCLCNEPLSKDTCSWSSDEEVRKSRRCQDALQRCRSETGRKGHQSTKLCRVLWAVTRINIFRDNSRTYEVMDATTIPPKCPPVRTEGVFVVKNPKKCCPESQKRIY